MIKQIIPEKCPACETHLEIRTGDKEGILKLICPNPLCEGTSLRKLQKGIQILGIRGIGPAVIEKLAEAGFSSSVDIFNTELMNEKYLIDSGVFKSGRSLEKLIESIKEVTEIPINLAIDSLQIFVPKDSGDGYISIGKSLSEQIGKMFSGVPYDFDGLSIQVRETIIDEKSDLYLSIKNSLESFEKNGVKIKKYDAVKKAPTKKISRNVFCIDAPLYMTKDELISKLEWNEVPIEDCDVILTNEKDSAGMLAEKYNKKIMTYSQVKILYL